MRKFIILSLCLSLFLSGFSLALAKQDKTGNFAPDSAVATESGTYDVQGHPELKVKVIVHKAGAPSSPSVGACGLADPDSSAVVPGTGWKLPPSWTYYLNSQSAPATVSRTSVSSIADNAFQAWLNQVGSKVVITKAGDTTIAKAARDGKNIIAWGRASGSALGITYIWYNPTTHIVTDLDTILNLKFKWAWSDPTGWPKNTNTTCAFQGAYDAQDILTHELGHWFGLDDVYTSDYTYNTMYGYGSTGQSNADTLTSGDIAGVQAIYK